MDLSQIPEDAQERRLVDLMVAYQNGDLSAFEQLYAFLVADARSYFLRVRRDRGMVHDLVQDLFLEIHRSRRTYNAPLPVRPWVFGIARNVLARSRRAFRKQPNTHIPLDMDGEATLAVPAIEPPSPESLDMERALAGLPAKARDPWLLHHVAGLSFQSIAARLGITVMAAKLRSSRATKALRAALNAASRARR